TGEAATPIQPPPPPSDGSQAVPGTVPTLEAASGQGDGTTPGQPGDGSSETAPLTPPVPPKQTVPPPAELPPQFY
ncbi:MAG: hypothetical protein ACOC0N_05715, partial [Chroococcales cyanobacterium]